MGSLKPGATYIYERQDGVVYAREFGMPSHTRIEIGHDWTLTDETRLWRDIHQAAADDPVLKEALDRVKILYYLSKEKHGS